MNTPFLFLIGIGFLGSDNGNYYSVTTSISDNGKYVVGYSTSPNTHDNDWLPYLNPAHEAFIFDINQNSMIGLGDLPDGEKKYFNSQAWGVSNNGVVVGKSVSKDSSKGVFWGWEGFKWTSQNGMMPIGVIDNGWLNYSVINDISNNNIMIGQINNNGAYQSIVIDPFDNMEIIPNISAITFSNLLDITPNGNMAVGFDMIPISENKRSEPRGIVYNTRNKLLYTPLNIYSVFNLISEDGRYIVGYTKIDIFFWNIIYDTHTNTLEILNHIPFFIPYDISNNGIIVGKIDIGSHNTYYVGCYYYNGHLEVITNHDEWEITSIQGITSDGTIWCGYGINPEGQIEGWYGVNDTTGY